MHVVLDFIETGLKVTSLESDLLDLNVLARHGALQLRVRSFHQEELLF
jgi:hypothetical protein